MEEKLYIVRLYDSFERIWIDITEPIPKEKADEIWNKKTSNGTKLIKYEDLSYYKIFLVDTKMLFRFGLTASGIEFTEEDKVDKPFKTFGDWFKSLLLVNTKRKEFGLEYPLGSCCYRDILRDEKVKDAMKEAWAKQLK